MSKYPGFDKLEEGSPLFYALPLCEILRSFWGDRDFSYISAAMFPIELTELILNFLKYDKMIDSNAIDDFSKRFLTEDPLCPIDALLALWGTEKFNQMTSELQILFTT